MNKFERLEELKKNMRNHLISTDAIPQEVIGIVKKTLEGLLEQYEQCQCNYPAIVEYTNGKFEELKKEITDKVGTSVREEQLAYLEYLSRKIERSIETLSDEQRKVEQEKMREEIATERKEDKIVGEEISQRITDALKNVQIRQNGILGARQYSSDRIEQIYQIVQNYIRNSESENAESIYAILQQNQKQLIEKWLDDYENYVQKEQQEEKKKPREQWDLKDREEFSLENQRKFIEKKIAEETKESQESKGKSELRSDIIL